MKAPVLVVLAMTLLCGCGRPIERKAGTLADARRGLDPKPGASGFPAEAVTAPPPAIFGLVRYDSPAGSLAAYVSPDPGDGRKHPAIVWITGGDCNSIGEVWEDQPRQNDQTASAYRKAGVVMMFPSLRGGNQNPGVREGFFGEVDDVIAAAKHLAMLDYVDPARVYLGGHSTGGTLAMLVAETTDEFRAVFAFGPVDDVSGYGPEYCPFNLRDRKQVEARSPGFWLDSARSPLFVIEGDSGNIGPLRSMEKSSKNPLIRFHALAGFDHFSTLGPMNALIASKIARDTGPKADIAFSPEELSNLPR